MTQNTEQNVRTVREQDGQVQEMHADMVKAVCGRRSDYPEDVFRAYLKRHIVLAEARGAEEQRRKDAEGDRPVAWQVRDMRGGAWPWKQCSESAHEEYKKHSTVETRELFSRPANVAALEARIAELTEAEQLARADAEASKARYAILHAAALSLVVSCEQDMCGEAVADELDSEPVSFFQKEDGTIGHSILTFGHIRNARAALTREGGV
ncbi:hypothetical protein [Gluconobacter cerinus]|uniref:Phage protein n=1 Tax=Gluconobacter cerinus TaxID=38307 RepID=A0AAV5NAR9_9PROT|nr:hypothetical protein [Gluconobacter cerinus]GBR03254.1 hypothetical protein AA0229_1899 [Gluconobacter cerinus NRIC 0229]GLQ61582.1 hypothetical protein GCM10007867_04270 [Gluconobacter cerinus]